MSEYHAREPDAGKQEDVQIETGLSPGLVKLVSAGGEPSFRHVFAPCLHRSSGGHYLVIFRGDHVGENEGESTNAQFLRWSCDRGATWRCANDGLPLVSSGTGSSFASPSAISHAWLWEDPAQRTWIYYTVNQPFTWGRERPDWSTGGGEIRKIELWFDGQTWRLRGASLTVWSCFGALPDGAGGEYAAQRVVSWNGLCRTRRGTLLLPMGGRTTVPNPVGAFWPLNRVWVLESVDDGATWRKAYFMGGSEGLALAEPTLIETGVDDEIVCLMRCQYHTGNELYQSRSTDGGHTWSEPFPTGLPNANWHGAKPFLFRTADATCWLVQTNEHAGIERTNLAVFMTDDDGLRTGRWHALKTMSVRNRTGWWPGSCYGWLEQLEHPDEVGVVFGAVGPDSHDLFFGRIRRAEIEAGPIVEPNGVVDEQGNDLPEKCQTDGSKPTDAFRLVTTRSRLVATQWFRFKTYPMEIRFRLKVDQATVEEAFPLMSAWGRNGRLRLGALTLTAREARLRIHANQTEVMDAPPLTDGAWHEVRCRFEADHTLHVSLDGRTVADGSPCFVESIAPLTTVLWGGGLVRRECCSVSVAGVSYGSIRDRCVNGALSP